MNTTRENNSIIPLVISNLFDIEIEALFDNIFSVDSSFFQASFIADSALSFAMSSALISSSEYSSILFSLSSKTSIPDLQSSPNPDRRDHLAIDLILLQKQEFLNYSVRPQYNFEASEIMLGANSLNSRNLQFDT